MQRRTASLTPELRLAWIEAVQTLSKSMGEAAVERLITSGRINDILTPEKLDAATASLRRGVLRGVQGGAQTIIGALPESAQLSFSLRANPRILDAIRDLDSALLKPLKAELRETVRLAVEQGIRDGKNPRAVARGLRDVIGLAPNQLQEVENYRQALLDGRIGKALSYELRDKRFDNTVKKGEYDNKKIDVMVQRYAEKRKADHANTIARTAALNANRQGADSAFQSAIDGGLVDPARAYKVWVTVGDSRVREEHAAMDGERVRYDEPFSNGLLWPSEYNCRCIVAYEMEPLPPLT